MTRTALALLLTSVSALAADPADIPSGAKMSWLANDLVRVGVDLNRGGAITYLAREGGGNLINNFDFGRQVQLSFYSGPVPFAVGENRPAKHWEHIGWNPVQTGDDFKHASRVLDHRNDGRTIYVKCAPMQWPLNSLQYQTDGRFTRPFAA